MKQNRWYAIRISPTMIPQIKYIAMYETRPVSAIGWIGEVKKIEKCVRPGYEKTGKYEVFVGKKEHPELKGRDMSTFFGTNRFEHIINHNVDDLNTSVKLFKFLKESNPELIPFD